MTKYNLLERSLNSVIKHPYRAIGTGLVCLFGVVGYGQITVDELSEKFCQQNMHTQSCLDSCVRDNFYDLTHNYRIENNLALRIAEDTCKNEN
ncbi:MAG: hypothetical protein WCV90_04890 [Candidatus Woesearchaeota archaeon]|jgi:hypothetical protein